MAIKVITIETMEYLAYRLAKKTMEWNEPIPDFSTRYPNVLEGCLRTPFQTYDKKDLYKGLIKKSSILFYILVKDHPFQNGNKRITVTTLLLFLYLNNKWLKVDTKELYNFAVWIAQSPPGLKSSISKTVEEFIKKNIVDTDKKQT